MILTEETQWSYTTASMETEGGRDGVESDLFGAEVGYTRVPKSTVPAWESNTSQQVTWLNSAAQRKIGPNQLLKVMAGDQLTTTVKYYFGNTAAPQSGSYLAAQIASIIGGLILANPGSSDALKAGVPGIQQQLGLPSFDYWLQYNPDNGNINNPKANLSILFFDERFNFVSDNSQQVRVVTAGNGAAPLVLSNIKAPKNGYCFIYVSNESSESVYFDDLQIRHDRGRILEENHYYAYGLKIAPLSSKAFGGAPNNYQYQGDYSEFDDDLGWNDFMLRSYDAQIGRFLQYDPYDQFASGYVGMGNDPGNNVDPTGGWGEPSSKDGPGKLYRSRDAAAWGWARYYIRESLDNNVEIASIIYEVICNGKKYYGFTEGVKSPRVKERYHESPGPFHFLNKKTDKDYDSKWDFSYVVPKGVRIVGHIHSHGGANGNEGNKSMSPDDRKNLSKYSDMYHYLVNFGGELRKYHDSYEVDWKPGKTIVDGLYRGKNPKNTTLNNGDGKKAVEFDDGNNLTDPIKDGFMFGNAYGSKIVSNQQGVNMVIQLGKMVASGVGLATATQKLLSTATGIPCPKF